MHHSAENLVNKEVGAKHHRSKQTTKAEWVLNCVESLNQQNDWSVEMAQAIGMLDLINIDIDDMARIYNERSGQKLALSVQPYESDLREDWWTIGNQGSTGSCVGWATESLLRYHFVKSNWIPQQSGSTQLSVRQLWMESKEFDRFQSRPTTFIEDAGTSIKTALDMARKYGTVVDDILPFSGNLYRGNENWFFIKAAQMRIPGYVALGGGSQAISKWINWLRQVGPIVTRLNVDKNWMDCSGNGHLDMYDSATAKGGHAVTVVGFQQGRFIIRNSWGVGWGDNGYAYASINYAQAAFTESYGLISPPRIARWSSVDLHESLPNIPSAVDNPFGYIMGGSNHVVFRGDDQHIHELWWTQGTGWKHNDLAHSSGGAPSAEGEPAAYILGDSQHVVYRGQDQHIHELWWSQGTGWKHNDLSNASGHTPPATNSPSGYILGNSQHVVYRGQDQHIHELWWTQGTGWKHNDLTYSSGAAPAATDSPFGYIMGGSQHVVYRGQDQHIHELWWTQGTGWKHGDLTHSSGGAPSSVGKPVAYILGDSQHVVYRGDDQHIHELWWTQGTGWKHGDLNYSDGNTPVSAGDPSGYILGGSQHVVFRDSNYSIHELTWLPNTGWKHYNLSKTSECSIAAAGDPVGYILGGSQHIVFLGADKHIHELWWG